MTKFNPVGHIYADNYDDSHFIIDVATHDVGGIYCYSLLSLKSLKRCRLETPDSLLRHYRLVS